MTVRTAHIIYVMIALTLTGDNRTIRVNGRFSSWNINVPTTKVALLVKSSLPDAIFVRLNLTAEQKNRCEL